MSMFAKKDRYANALQQPAVCAPRPVVHRAPVILDVDETYEEFSKNDTLLNDEPVKNYSSDDSADEYTNLGRTDDVYLPRPAMSECRFRPMDEEDERPVVPLSKFPATAWSSEASKKIGERLSEADQNSEDDLILDDVDIISGYRSPTPLRINTTVVCTVQHVISREPAENPVTKQKKIMADAYEQNSKLFGPYFQSRIAVDKRGVNSARAVQPQPKLVEQKKVVRHASPNMYVVLAEPTPQLSQVDKLSIQRFCENEAAAEADEMAAQADEVVVPAAIQETVDAEVRARAQAKLDSIKIKLDKRHAAAAAKRAATAVAHQVQNNLTKKVKPVIKHITTDVLYQPAAASLDPRAALLQIHDPVTILTLVGMLTKKPEEICKCRDDRAYTIPLPPLAKAAMVASPTQINIIYTPPIAVSLCRQGNECAWYKKQAYLSVGQEVPREFRNARECHFMHYATEPLSLDISSMSNIDSIYFVQCSIQGCTAPNHYLPHDDETIHVVHMTPMSEDCRCHHCANDGWRCMYDGKNFCQNTLIDGCCRKHSYTGPILATLMMRSLLAVNIADPHKWQAVDYSNMVNLWKQIVAVKVPGTATDLGEIFRIRGIWPADKRRDDRKRDDRKRDGRKRDDKKRDDKKRDDKRK